MAAQTAVVYGATHNPKTFVIPIKLRHIEAMNTWREVVAP